MEQKTQTGALRRTEKEDLKCFRAFGLGWFLNIFVLFFCFSISLCSCIGRMSICRGTENEIRFFLYGQACFAMSVRCDEGSVHT